VSNTNPFTEAHAIARLDFALIFQSNLSDEQRAQLALELQKHLDQFERMAEDDSGEDDEPVTAFERKGEGDEVTEVVHIHGNYAHVVWSDYRGWSFSRDGAIDYLRPVLQWVRDGRLVLTSVGLAYRDVFFNEEPDTYDAGDVLKIGSPYVAPKVFSSGTKWRHWLAWSDSNLVGASVRAQSTLHIEANLLAVGEDEATIHCTEIAHRQNVRWGHAAVLTNPSDDDLRNAWDCAHRANHALIQELITDEMLERIGLKEGSNECPLLQ